MHHIECSVWTNPYLLLLCIYLFWNFKHKVLKYPKNCRLHATLILTVLKNRESANVQWLFFEFFHSLKFFNTLFNCILLTRRVLLSCSIKMCPIGNSNDYDSKNWFFTLLFIVQGTHSKKEGCRLCSVDILRPIQTSLNNFRLESCTELKSVRGALLAPK